MSRVIVPFIALLFPLSDISGYPSEAVTVSNPWLWLSIVFGILLALSAWVSPIADLLFIVFFIVFEIGGLDPYDSSTFYGIYVIAALWIMRSWTIPGLFLIMSVDAYWFYDAESWKIALFSACILTLLSLGFAFTFRYQRMKLQQTEDALELAEETGERLRQDLASQLHDTIAKDLTQISIIAQQLTSANGGENRGQLEELSVLASRTARQIRPTILNLNSERTTYTLGQAIADSVTMLTTRSITLNVETPSDMDGLLSRRQKQSISLIVREGATNILKYAPAKSSAHLTIEIDELSNAYVSMSNLLTPPDEQKDMPEITGGFGLANLENRIRDEGGELTFWQTSTRWMLSAILPSTKGIDNE